MFMYGGVLSTSQYQPKLHVLILSLIEYFSTKHNKLTALATQKGLYFISLIKFSVKTHCQSFLHGTFYIQSHTISNTSNYSSFQKRIHKQAGKDGNFYELKCVQPLLYDCKNPYRSGLLCLIMGISSRIFLIMFKLISAKQTSTPSLH